MKKKNAISLETFAFLGILIFVIWYMQSIMGLGPMFSTLMNTAHSLLLDVVFYIMAISVIASAFSALATEFGVVALFNKLISPIMRPIYGLPGAASLGVVTTFISDNPAILSLAKDHGFRRYFNSHQLPALCNLGTSFGMGLILCTYMLGLGTGNEFFMPVGCGLFGAFIGSIFSVRLMIKLTKHFHKKHPGCNQENTGTSADSVTEDVRYVEGGIFTRVFNCLLEGGKTGVQLGMEIIPGVLTICTGVMILTYGPGTVNGVPAYTGAAYEGIALIPRLGELLQPVTNLLFGFQDASAIAFPLTALGSSGAAMGLVPKMLASGAAAGNEIAVFTAIGMCWSGYLSTHISMMDSLRKRELTGQAIISHTIGGLIAGIAAHYSFYFFSML